MAYGNVYGICIAIGAILQQTSILSVHTNDCSPIQYSLNVRDLKSTNMSSLRPKTASTFRIQSLTRAVSHSHKISSVFDRLRVDLSWKTLGLVDIVLPLRGFGPAQILRTLLGVWPVIVIPT